MDKDEIRRNIEEEFDQLAAHAAASGTVKLRIKLCEGHYKSVEETRKALPLRHKIGLIILMKLKILNFVKLPAMQSDQCIACRSGGGGGRKPEITIR